jgi:hypothetical protein
MQETVRVKLETMARLIVTELVDKPEEASVQTRESRAGNSHSAGGGSSKAQTAGSAGDRGCSPKAKKGV